MSRLPGLPKVAKAAIVVFEPPANIPSVITFQYNPETVSRDIKASAVEGGDRSDAFRLTGAPPETWKVEVMLDATDALVAGETVGGRGIFGEIAAFENLLAPKSATVIANTIALASGTIEILPATAPFTVLVWGQRVLPVRISGLSVTEEAFDIDLNPVRAKIALDMMVLTYSDLQVTHPGYAMYLGHQIVRETMGQLARKSVPEAILSQKISTG
ncbi:hypothetical protein [Pacificoceanicola onchidii]|uniref:CIS tube protein n=1 Tax=Pacificoceanicola onchidii TaxID=2562685 RepID=UPI0010A4056C|nr:hypothetical protein [Pacificoceanicola onchidii]